MYMFKTFVPLLSGRAAYIHSITRHEGPERGRGVALLFLYPQR